MRALINWLQKTVVITVALLTFGVITPAHDIWNAFQHKDDSKLSEGSQAFTEIEVELLTASSYTERETIPLEEQFSLSAKELAYEKFGNKIGPIIQNEFDEVIFPKIDEVIRMTLDETDDELQKHLAISERPTGNYSEKIFHVFNSCNGEDLIRFHVRTDRRPLDGYFFNFHYHVAEDDFTQHYVLGDIYWSKNTPPKWLT